MKTILVVANETLGGARLLELVEKKVEEAGDARLVLCVPRTNPRHGNIIYEDAVYDAAKVRIDLARRYFREEGIQMVGEIGDPDPYTATMDAVAEHRPDEIVVSTYPAASSGWLRRDLIDRIREATGLPVEHIEQDINTEGIPFDVTLVVAARTAAGDELLEALKRKATPGGERPHVFIVVVPQEGGGGGAAGQARQRMAQLVDRLVAEGLLAAGMIGDPDPYTAAMQGLQFFHITDVVISTLPATRSGWLRADLIERVRKSSNKPVEHVAAADTAAAGAA